MTDQAQQAWIINGGRHDVYSSCEGAGGYENELIIHLSQVVLTFPTMDPDFLGKAVER